MLVNGRAEVVDAEADIQRLSLSLSRLGVYPWVTWTPGTIVDGGRLTHNPEVEGSNPSPATKARGPFRQQRKGPWHVVC